MDKKRWMIPLCLVLVLMAGVILVLLVPKAGDSVSIGGLEIAGLNPWQTWQKLKMAEDTFREGELVISLPEETFRLPHQDLGIKLDRVNLVWSAFRPDKGSDAGEISLTAALSYAEDRIRTQLQTYAERYDSVLTQPSHHLEGEAPLLGTAEFEPEAPCQTLILNPGTPECHLDVGGVLEQVRELYAGAFGAAEFTLSNTPVPSAMPEELDLQEIAGEYCREAVDDSLDMETYQFVSGSYGYDFDRDAAKQQLKKAAWGQDISLPMESVQPEILGDAVYFRDVLGHCETKHNTNENRNTNLRLVCQALDGLILQPGEEFSYNGTVGERTAERGYKPAGAYSGDRLIESIGGGVCQGSTTLYNCALLADLEVLERVCHGFTVTYVPIGLDAAVNWATKTDMKFRNSWNFPIKIKAEVSDGYMRMQILGTDEKDYYIEMASSHENGELRIYSNSYKKKFDKETGEMISKELEARSAYMYFGG